MTALNLGQVCGNAAAVGPGTPALGSLSPLSPVGGWVSGEGRIAGPVSPPLPARRAGLVATVGESIRLCLLVRQRGRSQHAFNDLAPR